MRVHQCFLFLRERHKDHQSDQEFTESCSHTPDNPRASPKIAIRGLIGRLRLRRIRSIKLNLFLKKKKKKTLQKVNQSEIMQIPKQRTRSGGPVLRNIHNKMYIIS